MKRCTLFAAVLVAAQPAVATAPDRARTDSSPAVTADVHSALPQAPPPVAVAGPLFAAPTRLDRIGRILAPVMINGRGPFRLMVDTGANKSVLTTRLVTALGLAITPDNQVKLNGVTGSVLVPTIAIDTLQAGDLVQHKLQLPVLNSVMGGADGILGMHGFADKRITVDFSRDYIRIADSRGERAPRNFMTLPVTTRFGRLLLVTGRVGGVKVKAVIDTGAQRTLGNLALRDALLKRRRFNKEIVSTGVIGLTDDEQRGVVIHTPPIRLGDASISDVYVIYGDIHVFKLWDLQQQPALLVGMDVLGTLHTLVIDYRRKELQIRVHD